MSPDRSEHPQQPLAAVGASVRALNELSGEFASSVTKLAVLSMAAGVSEAAALLALTRAAVEVTTDDPEPVSVLGRTIDGPIGVLFLASAALVIVAMMAHYAAAGLTASMTAETAARTRRRLLDGFLMSRWEWVARQPHGRLVEAASQLTIRAAASAANLASGAAAAVALTVLWTAALIVAPVTSLVLSGCVLMLVITLRPILRLTRDRSRVDVDSSVRLTEEVARTELIARELFVTGVRRQQVDHLDRLVDGASGALERSARTTRHAAFLFKDLGLLAIVVAVGGLAAVSDLRRGSVAAAVLLLLRALVYLQQAAQSFQQATYQSAAIETLDAEIVAHEVSRAPAGTTKISTVGDIVLADVSYRYPDATDDAVHAINVRIETGSTVGLAGRSGTGKTTVGELLLGLRSPTSGKIEIGGFDLDQIRRDDWSRLTALVPQDPGLIHGSVLDNIRFLRPWVTEAAAVVAARLANIDGDIDAMPDRYATVLGPHGRGVSGGQAQRIAFARALAGDPELLVLDEPTSALDTAAEEAFRETIAELRGSRTIVVIAHRPGTLDVCDWILEMPEGSLRPNRPPTT